MTGTIINIGTEINNIISATKDIPKISEQEKIDKFLDDLNLVKSKLTERTEKINQLESLFTKITWLDLKNKEEEELLKKIISRSKYFYSRSIKHVVALKIKYWRKNLHRSEIKSYQDALEIFEETVLEVEEIFFSLRKDDEFNNLLNSL